MKRRPRGAVMAALVVLASCGSGEQGAPTEDAARDAYRDVPQLHLDTVNGVAIARDAYVDAEVRLVDGDHEVLRMATEVRGRGNSTWQMPKKPYRLRLEDGAALLGLPSDRDWALLANYADKSLIRNRLASDVGAWMGVAPAPRHAVVELHVNGSYEGVYDLYQQVEIDDDVIPVDELDPDVDAEPEVITGGYYLEVDHRFGEDVCWLTTLRVPICSRDPELDPDEVRDPAHPSARQLAFIEDYVNQAEQALRTPGDGYEEFFDRAALVNWYLASELFKNTDSRVLPYGIDPLAHTSSVLFYKPRGGPLVMGPLWDFDLAAGNVDFSDARVHTGWWIRQSVWIEPLFAHTSFGAHVRDRWCELQRAGLRAKVGAQLAAAADALSSDALARNFERWPILGTYVWPNGYVGATHADELAHVERWLTSRVDWMDAQLQAELGACPAG